MLKQLKHLTVFALIRFMKLLEDSEKKTESVTNWSLLAVQNKSPW